MQKTVLSRCGASGSRRERFTGVDLAARGRDAARADRVEGLSFKSMALSLEPTMSPLGTAA
jgi:hypothetical protein